MIPTNIKFIGNIGVGKTTAICRLLNLIKDNNPILDTASGRTTACDVHIWIRKDLRSSILVDQFSNTEFEMLLSDFVTKPFVISAELQTIIKNIVNSGDSNGSNYFEEKKRTFKIQEDFISFCKQKAKYNKRIEFCILNDSKTQSDDVSWIKENFHKINTGKHTSFGIPKKITINIDSRSIKNYADWFENKCFIDTKGIEVLNNQRSSKYVQKEIYCSSFSNGPENTILEQIRESTIDRNNKFILILPKFNQPEDVNGADGNYEAGVEIKMSEFVKSTNGLIDKQNILFYDSNPLRSPNDMFQLLSNYF